MRPKFLWTAVLICGGLLPACARAETLDALVKREEGIELGVCALTPRPSVAGEQVRLVVPARFANPAIWVTRAILFVGVDQANNVLGVVEAKALHDIPPREVVSVACRKNMVTIRMSGRMPVRTLSYVWNGKELRRK